jgi:gamma-glutamylcyclotransferase (GGCT)/AIG2-like uncharacterized protein YtfP
MAEKCLLFAYGTLQPGVKPPRSVANHWPDAVKGELYELAEYPVAVRVENAAAAAPSSSSSWIEGTTMEIDAAELETLDEYENLEGGEYVRRLVTTREGYVAWIYEYKLAVPAGTPRISKWPR